MTQNNNIYISSGNGPDFHLPDEILSVIPTDPYDQLDLARKITSMAIVSRVTKLETEAGRLRQNIAEKDHVIYELQEKISQLGQMLQETDARLQLALDENLKLSNERDTLVLNSKKLNKDLARLETFKRQLLQSLSDDNSSAETIDIGTCEQLGSISSSGSSVKDENSSNYFSSKLVLSGSTESRMQDALAHTGQKFSLTPYISPRLTPTGTPKVVSTSGSPRSYSHAGSPKSSGTTSPTKSQFDGRTGLSSWYPSSQQSSAPSSPPHARSLPARAPRIDGKEFFRQARSRLSYEQFSAFLANIKELNAHKQSREETLAKAEEIFGTDNKDLYLSFQGLLNRNLP